MRKRREKRVNFLCAPINRGAYNKGGRGMIVSIVTLEYSSCPRPLDPKILCCIVVLKVSICFLLSLSVLLNAVEGPPLGAVWPPELYTVVP